jgi:homoaconitase/3-isopropylmalate dehydratase large subunit
VNDDDARYREVFEINVGSLEPQVACPHSPANVRPVSEVEGLPIDRAFIGSCTGGRLRDLEVAARILAGKKVQPDVMLEIIPASQAVYKQALKAGYLEILLEAGAIVCNSTCGPCAGSHMGVLGAGEVCLSSTNRNLQGRMGDMTSQVYLASPATVAASALEGRIVNPQRYQ